ncbi:MAG: Pantothenate synthetase [Lactococcus sp.]|jgi:pantoate--beta-alanine ligase
MIPTATTLSELKIQLTSWRDDQLTIGLVPTMGFLHEGHQSLIKKAANDNNRVVVSIFVNPTQFAAGEDLDTYPRDLVQDQIKCQEAGADLIFAPDVSELYPSGFNTYVTTSGISDLLEGKSRPTHFRGVTTIVTKLFNLVQPTKAYFGQKDAQQVAVLQQMVRDLNQNLDLVVCPIIREPDGLAKSSRNTYLSTDARQQAVILSQALTLAETLIINGERETSTIIAALEGLIQSQPLTKIDYIKIVDPTTLQDMAVIDHKVLLLLAVYVDHTRLIDNTLIHLEA